ncbi:MAG: hypothetical protein M3388_19740 [Acidobacteriota bacterium]|nr:hypothetical protein [Acidobacteriota bacterium]
MLNNNHKNSSCGYTEQMVSYFYDETDQDYKAVFEAHLTNCSDCTDELAGFGFVRSSLIEWRDEEFFKLETPVFEIPTIKTLSQSVESDTRSWFSDFREMFSFNPITATAVLAALIVCVGLVFIAINSSKNSEVAEVDNKNSEKIVASPTVNNINEQPKEILAQDNSDKSFPNKSSNSTDTDLKDLHPLPIREKRLVSGDSVVRASDNTKNNIKKSETNRNLKETNKENIKVMAVQKRQLPNLTNLEDGEEDKSVRLTDLFEEIGSK